MTDLTAHSHHATSGRITAHIYPVQEHYIIRGDNYHSAITIPGGTRHGLTDDDITALEGLWEAQALDTLQTPTEPWQIIARVLSVRGHLGQYRGLRDMGIRARLDIADGAALTVARHDGGYNITFQTADGETLSETVDTSDRAIDASLMVTTGHALRLRRQPLIRRIQDRAAPLGIVVTRESLHVLSSTGGGITILPPDEAGRPGVGRTWDGASLRSHSDWDLITYALDALLD